MTLLLNLIASSALSFGPSCSASQPTIAEIAQNDGRFQTLVAAVEAAGLTEALQNSDEYTVFAPTDEAFAKLPKGTVETLLKPENKEALKAVLLYHVVPGNMAAKNVVSSKNLMTANGQRLDILMGLSLIHISEPTRPS